MLRYKFVITAILLLVLASCGGNDGRGGGGGSDGGNNNNSTSVNASPVSLSFTAVENSTAVITKTLDVDFNGAGLLVGYPVGVPGEDWLMVENDTYTSSPASVNFTVSAANLDTGTYQTRVRLVTGKEDGSDIKFVDIPVTFVVTGGINIDKTSLTFTMMEASALPLEQTINLHTGTIPADWQLSVQYSGDTAGWINLESSSGTLTSSNLPVKVSTDELPQGQYSANILLRDGNGQIYDTASVTYNVTAGFSISGITDKSITEQANTEDLEWSLALESQFDPILGSGLQWNLESNQAWLSVVNSSGNFSSSQSIQVKLLADELMLMEDGSYDAVLTLSVPGSSIKPRTIPIHISLNLQPILFLTGLDDAPASFSYFINNSSNEQSLTKSFKVISNTGSAFNSLVNWEAVVGNPWLTVVDQQGDTNSNSTLRLRVNKDAIANMDNGSYHALVSLTADNPRYRMNLVNISLGVHLAKIEHLAPYLAYTGRSEPVVIRGENFIAQPPMKVDVGGNLVDATVVNNTEIHIKYPVLSSEQRVNLTIPNELQLTRGGAELVFKNPPVYTAQKIPLPVMSRAKITLDPERQAILISDPFYLNEITRLRLTTNGWETDSFALPHVRSATVTLDGKEILVAQADQSEEDKIFHLDPDTLDIKATTHLSNDDYEKYDIVAPFNDGRTIIFDSNQGTASMYYPSQEVFDPEPWLSDLDMALSRDRSFMFLMNTNTGESHSFVVNGSTFTQRTLDESVFQLDRISMSSDVGRFVAGSDVFDRNFTLLGQLSPAIIPYYVAVTPNGKHLYVASSADIYTYSYYFKRYDISGASGPYVADSEDLGITLDTNDIPVAMKVSDDGSALFVLSAHVEHPYTVATNLYVFPIEN